MLIPLLPKKDTENASFVSANSVEIPNADCGDHHFRSFPDRALLRRLETELNLTEMSEGTFRKHAVGVRMMNAKPVGKKRRMP